MKYYCPECDRYHYRGQIYQDHLKYKRKVPEELDSEFIKATNKQKEKLEQNKVAQRQLLNLARRYITEKDDERRKVYITHINKLIRSV